MDATMRRIPRLLFWLTPPCMMLALYWHGFHSWFQKDDFAWLGLPMEWRDGKPWFDLVFRPMAQGTIRPWSDRLFFLSLGSAFGLNPAPFHAVVFVTMAASLALLQWIALRATRQWATALAAPLVWLCSVGLASPLSWLSAWNQILCAFFLLAALACLVKALETGGRRWWLAQYGVFVLGFGALEVNIVYPALALGWACLMDGEAGKRDWKKTLPLFAISVGYAVAHALMVEKGSGVYARHWDVSILKTFVRYCEFALGGGMTPYFLYLPPQVWRYTAWVLAAVLLALTARAWRKESKLAAFGLLWFCAVISPVLPLRDHVEAYYLGSASVGVGLAWAGALGAMDGRRLKLLAVGAMLVHAVFSLPLSRTLTVRHRTQGESARVLVEGLERAKELHPNGAVFLSGVSSDLYWAALAHEPQRLFGLKNVWLLPGEGKDYILYPNVRDITRDVAAEGVVARTLGWGDGRVYRVEETHLREATGEYWRAMPKTWFGSHPRMIDAGQPAFARDLGDGWYQLEGTWRWMGKRAVVYLSAMGAGDWDLFVAGSCSEQALREGPRELTIHVNGERVGTVQISTESPSFETTFPLEGVAADAPLEVVLEVSRTWRAPGDSRDLGVSFGQIGLRARSLPGIP